jgi:hypothetical protein
MTLKSKRRQIRLIQLDPQSEEEAHHHIELERLYENAERSSEEARNKTIEMARRMENQYYRENRDVSELRRICARICDKHPKHARQIRRYFNWSDPITNEQPYLRYKGLQGPKSDEKNLTSVNFSAEDIAESEEEKDIYIEDMDNNSVRLDNLTDDHVKEIFLKREDSLIDAERELKRRGNAIPPPFSVSYLKRRRESDDNTFTGIYEPERKSITLRPADIPADELTRMFQEWEGNLHYYKARMHKKFGDKLMKMNYISDNVELNERLLAELLSEILTFTGASLQIFKQFMDYWERRKSKDKMTSQDKEIITKLLHAISHMKT